MDVVEDTARRPDEADATGEAVVERLGVHPVKSLRGLEPESWWFDRHGPWLDRRWMLVDDDGRFLSLREAPTLARCRVTMTPPAPRTGDLLPRLELAWNEDRFTVDPEPDEARRSSRATLWGAERVVVDEGDPAANWLSERLGRRVRLVRHLPDRDPWRQPDPLADGASTGLSDGYPVLVVALSTIEAAVGVGWSPRRFRANILVTGVPPHAEDRWATLQIGEVVLELVKPCVRCVATTVDPETGERSGPEPLRTLSRTRTWEGRPVLGWNALVRSGGVVAAGMPVRVASWRPAGGLGIQTGIVASDE